MEVNIFSIPRQVFHSLIWRLGECAKSKRETKQTRKRENLIWLSFLSLSPRSFYFLFVCFSFDGFSIVFLCVLKFSPKLTNVTNTEIAMVTVGGIRANIDWRGKVLDFLAGTLTKFIRSFSFGHDLLKFVLRHKLVKVIPQYCIAHPYCARFLASSARAHSARTLTTWRFLYETKLAREIKGHILLNQHGDLSFFLHNFN